jgi:hypothetical protein
MVTKSNSDDRLGKGSYMLEYGGYPLPQIGIGVDLALDVECHIITALMETG